MEILIKELHRHIGETGESFDKLISLGGTNDSINKIHKHRYRGIRDFTTKQLSNRKITLPELLDYLKPRAEADIKHMSTTKHNPPDCAAHSINHSYLLDEIYEAFGLTNN